MVEVVKKVYTFFYPVRAELSNLHLTSGKSQKLKSQRPQEKAQPQQRRSQQQQKRLPQIKLLQKKHQLKQLHLQELQNLAQKVKFQE